MKIVVLDGYTENPGDLSWEGFWQFGEVTVYDRTEEEEIINRIGDAQAVITNKTPITRETLNACPDIQYIGVLATGYNVVDTDAAKERNPCLQYPHLWDRGRGAVCHCPSAGNLPSYRASR